MSNIRFGKQYQLDKNLTGKDPSRPVSNTPSAYYPQQQRVISHQGSGVTVVQMQQVSPTHHAQQHYVGSSIVHGNTGATMAQAQQQATSHQGLQLQGNYSVDGVGVTVHQQQQAASPGHSQQLQHQQSVISCGSGVTVFSMQQQTISQQTPTQSAHQPEESEQLYEPTDVLQKKDVNLGKSQLHFLGEIFKEMANSARVDDSNNRIEPVASGWEQKFDYRFGVHPQKLGNSARPFTLEGESAFTKDKDLLLGGRFGDIVLSHALFPLLQNYIRVPHVCLEFMLIVVDLILSAVSYAMGNTPAYALAHLIFASIALVFTAIDFGGLFCCICNCKTCNGSKSACKECSRVLSAGDITRQLVAELIIVPMLVCDIFEVIIEQGYKNDKPAVEQLGFAFFVFDLFILVVFVYGARVGIMFNSIRNLYAAAKLDKNLQTTTFLSELFFELAYTAHVIGQLLIQSVMLVVITAQIQHEFQVLQLQNPDGPYYPGGLLIYMCVAVCILPFSGLFSFFVTASYWTQNFRLLHFKHFAKVLHSHCKIDIFSSKEDHQKFNDRFKKLKTYLKLNRRALIMSDKIDKFIKNRSFFDNVKYSISHPFPIIFSLLHFTGHFAFFLCAGLGYLSIANDALESHWVIGFIVFAVIIDFIVNFNTFVIAIVWIIIIIVVIHIVVFFIALFCFCCIASGGQRRK